MTVTAQVPSDPSLIRNSVTLLRYDPQGHAVGLIGILYDDGTHGDPIAGDNFFTLQLSLNETLPGQLVFGISAAYKTRLQRVLSPTFTVDIVHIPSQGEIQAITATNQMAVNVFDSMAATGGMLLARNALVGWLQQQPTVRSAGLAADGQSVWVQYTNGLYGGMFTGPSGTWGGVPSTYRGLVASPVAYDNGIAFAEYELESVYNKWQSSGIIQTDPIIRGSGASIDLMRNLSPYGVISLAMHGLLNKSGDPMLEVDGTGTIQDNVDWARGYLYVNIRYTEPWFVLPEFIRHYNKLPGSIVFLSACHSLDNNKLSQALINSGAQAVFGWTNNVSASFAKKTKDALMVQMLDVGMSAGEAYAAVAHVDTDCTVPECNPPATLMLDGDSSASLVKHARFTISSGNQTASDGQMLSITLPPGANGVAVVVTSATGGDLSLDGVPLLSLLPGGTSTFQVKQGTHTLSLTLGKSIVQSKIVVSTPNQPPTAGFFMSTAVIAPTRNSPQPFNVLVANGGNANVTFDASPSTDPDGDAISNWQWLIDGRDPFLRGDPPAFTQSLAIGSHSVSLSVQDSRGAWSAPVTATVSVTQVALPNTFDFAVDSLSVTGNLATPFFDDFNGTVNTPPTSAFGCVADDVPTEAGGFLLLRSADVRDNVYTDPQGNTFAVMNCLLGVRQTAYRIQRGSGNSVITASFRPDLPNSKQSYGLQFFTYGVPANEFINMQVSSGGSGQVVITTAVQTPSGNPTPQSVPISLNGVQRIMLRLSYNDATGAVTPSYSLNNGASFVNTAPTGTVLRAGTQATASIFGSVLLSSSPNTPATLTDNLTSGVLNSNRWLIEGPPGTGTQGMVSPTNQGVVISMGSGNGGAGIYSKCQLSGDFDVQVDYALWTWQPNNQHTVQFRAIELPAGQFGSPGPYRGGVPDANGMVLAQNVFQTPSNGDTTGSLRFTRQNSTLAGYFRGATGAWILIGSGAGSSSPTRVALELGTNATTAPGGTTIAFKNVQQNSGTLVCP